MKLLLLGLLAWSALSAETSQPIPFSHKVHAGTSKIQCKTCHPNPGIGEVMTIVPASKCMQCHSAIKTDSESIKKLAGFAKNDAEVKWARLYEVPSYVRFSHRTHIESGNTCDSCHGKVAEREVLAHEGDISMGGCMNCHRAKKVSIDCTFCHEAQN